MQPRITQVPPRRYSSASMTRAPCCAAMRAARTPPEPPPMTNRSTSKSDMLHIVSALLHFGAQLAHDFDGKIVAPAARIGHAFVERPRLVSQHFLTDRRLVEGENLLEFRLGEMARIKARGRVHDLLPAGLKVLVDLGRDVADVLGPHRVGLNDRIRGLLDHAVDQGGEQ